MTQNKTFVAGALLLLAAAVPAVAYHIDPQPINAAGLGPGDWTFTLGSVVIVCESNGPLDDRNDNPVATPAAGGPCTSGENDATGTFPPGQGMPGTDDDADAPASGDWVRMDACARTVVARGLNLGDFRFTAVTNGGYAQYSVVHPGDLDEGETLTAGELLATDPDDPGGAVVDADDELYSDEDGDEAVSIGDFRYTAITTPLPYAAGTTVAALDGDIGQTVVYDEGELLRTDPDGGGLPGLNDDLYFDDLSRDYQAGAPGGKLSPTYGDNTDTVSGGDDLGTPLVNEGQFVAGACSDMNDLPTDGVGVETDQHTWTASLGVFQCGIPTVATSQLGVTEDYAFYYDRLYSWYSYDGDGWYTVGDDVGPHKGDNSANNNPTFLDNEDAFQGHVTAFLSTTAADHRAAGFSVTGSMEVVDATALPDRDDVAATSNGGVSNACGASPSLDPSGGQGNPAGPVFRAPNDCAPAPVGC